MKILALILVLTVLLVAGADGALAYIGPGAGLSAIGTVVALVAAVAFAIVGFVWYPLKRLRAKVRAGKERKADGNHKADSS